MITILLKEKEPFYEAYYVQDLTEKTLNEIKKFLNKHVREYIVNIWDTDTEGNEYVARGFNIISDYDNENFVVGVNEFLIFKFDYKHNYYEFITCTPEEYYQVFKIIETVDN